MQKRRCRDWSRPGICIRLQVKSTSASYRIRIRTTAVVVIVVVIAVIVVRPSQILCKDADIISTAAAAAAGKGRCYRSLPRRRRCLILGKGRRKRRRMHGAILPCERGCSQGKEYHSNKSASTTRTRTDNAGTDDGYDGQLQLFVLFCLHGIKFEWNCSLHLEPNSVLTNNHNLQLGEQYE